MADKMCRLRQKAYRLQRVIRSWSWTETERSNRDGEMEMDMWGMLRNSTEARKLIYNQIIMNNETEAEAKEISLIDIIGRIESRTDRIYGNLFPAPQVETGKPEQPTSKVKYLIKKLKDIDDRLESVESQINCL